MPSRNKSPKQIDGKKAEDLAASHFLAQGYEIIARNWRHGRAEVDMILSYEGILVFVEVKARNRTDYGFPEQFVSEGQMRRILSAADAWLYNQPWPGPVRFDILAITIAPGTEPLIEHFADAFG